MTDLIRILPIRTRPSSQTTVTPQSSELQRLEGQLPYEWTRIQWASQMAREVWEPRISRISQMHTAVEFQSVQSGLRKAALLNVSPDEFINLSEKATSEGLSLVPIAKHPAGLLYSSSSVPYKDGPWTYRAVLSAFPRKMIAALKDNDSNEIGYFLGYPSCCRSFFKKYWEDGKYLDTTWPMAEKFATNRIANVADTPYQANILLRWAGIRNVSHLPCSFDCAKTVEVGDQYTKLALNLKFYKEILWLKEMLSWPIEWSALHGIAEIKTPVFRISTRTDLTAEKYIVRYHGILTPFEGSRAMQFPFIRDPYWSRPDWWTSNGFSSKSAMEESHNGILGATLSLAPSQVFDFGCGNGTLLDKIGRIHPQTELIGIEIDPKRCQEGRELYGSRVPKRIAFYNTGIRDFVYPYTSFGAVGVISCPRFVEQDLNEFVKNSKIKRWILYSYSDTTFFVPECFKSFKMVTQYKDAFVHLIVVENVTS